MSAVMLSPASESILMERYRGHFTRGAPVITSAVNSVVQACSFEDKPARCSTNSTRKALVNQIRKLGFTEPENFITSMDGLIFNSAIEAAIHLYQTVYSKPCFLCFRGLIKNQQNLTFPSYGDFQKATLSARLETMYGMWVMSGEAEIHLCLRALAVNLSNQDLITFSTLQRLYREKVLPHDKLANHEKIDPKQYFLYWYFKSLWTFWA